MGIFRIDEGIGKSDGILSRAAPYLTASTGRLTMRRDIAICIGERCAVGVEKKVIGASSLGLLSQLQRHGDWEHLESVLTTYPFVVESLDLGFAMPICTI